MLGHFASGKPLPTTLNTTVSLLASAKQLGRQYPEYWACVQRDLDIDKEALRKHVPGHDFEACGGYWLEGLAPGLGAVGWGHNKKQFEQAIALAIAVAMGVTQLATPSDSSDSLWWCWEGAVDFNECVEQAAKLLEALPPPPPPRSPQNSNAPPHSAGPPPFTVGVATSPPPELRPVSVLGG